MRGVMGVKDMGVWDVMGVGCDWCEGCWGEGCDSCMGSDR